MHAILNGNKPDRVPFMPFSELIPRGAFEREMRNRGMGLITHCTSIWSEVPDVAVTEKCAGGEKHRIYKTPAGEVSEVFKVHVGAIENSSMVQKGFLIKDVKDYGPVIFMIDNTVFHVDNGEVERCKMQLGGDGVIHTFKERGKVCTIHADALNLYEYKELIKETGIDVVEAFTPPPVGNLSLYEARKAWGEEVTIWINFPETIFYSGYEETKKYTAGLLKSDPCHRKFIGFTEMGLMGADGRNLEMFRNGIRAIMDAIDEYGIY